MRIQGVEIKDKSNVIFKNFHGHIEIGSVIHVGDKSVNVVWLDGYKSRNDDLTKSQILGIVDIKQPVIEIPGFSGHFKLFVDAEKLKGLR